MQKNTLVAIDIAKDVFHLVVFDASGNPIKRKKVQRRAQFVKAVTTLDVRCVAMEACGGSHHWARRFEELGFEVALLPPQHVKAYARGQKNDYNDALAIGEAFQHGRIRPVAVRSLEQQDQQSLLRMRQHWMRRQGDLIRQCRSLLSEYGIVLPKRVSVTKRLPAILEDGDNGLTDFMRMLLHRQYEQLVAAQRERDWYDQQVSRWAKTDEDCRRLMEAPGFGVVVSTQMKNWMGDGHQFKSGRDAASALGVVPRQHSSGDKNRLGGITKRGDKTLRSQLVHGARAVVSRSKHKQDALSQWIQKLVQRRGFNKAVVALANKMVRVAWVIIARGEAYRAPDSPALTAMPPVNT